MDPDASILEPPPSVFNYVLSFLLVGVAWGFTTPFIRRAAADFNARQEAQRDTQPELQQGKEVPLKSREENNKEKDDSEAEHEEDIEDEDETEESEEGDNPSPPTKQPAWMNPTPAKPSWPKQKLTTLLWTVFNLLRTPAYSIPLVVNLTGSVWFFLLVGKHELSLTVPLANSSAFLFTVLGEWYVERKMIAKETWLGMGLVLGGFALCVQSKQ